MMSHLSVHHVNLANKSEASSAWEMIMKRKKVIKSIRLMDFYLEVTHHCVFKAHRHNSSTCLEIAFCVCHEVFFFFSPNDSEQNVPIQNYLNQGKAPAPKLYHLVGAINRQWQSTWTSKMV